MSQASLQAVAKVVCAHLKSARGVTIDEIPDIIRSTRAALQTSTPQSVVAIAPPQPAVPVRSSIHEDYIVCLHCSERYRSLKRHLLTAHHQTDNDYRATFGLPYDYPMVAPSYSSKRAELARKIGLGRKALDEVVDNTASDAEAGRTDPVEDAADITAAAEDAGVEVEDVAAVVVDIEKEAEAESQPVFETEDSPVAQSAADEASDDAATDDAEATAGEGAGDGEITLEAAMGALPEGFATIQDTFKDGKIVSLLDGKEVTDLGSYIRKKGVNAADYRARYGLPTDYPMTSKGVEKFLQTQ